jgi:hypothetical protein
MICVVVWGSNGPQLIEKVLKAHCKTENFLDFSLTNANIVNYKSQKTKEKMAKCDVIAFPDNYYLPYQAGLWRRLFKINSEINIAVFKDSYFVHFYSALSINEKVIIGSNSIFEYFAHQNCYLIYTKIQQRKDENERYFGVRTKIDYFSVAVRLWQTPYQIIFQTFVFYLLLFFIM